MKSVRVTIYVQPRAAKTEIAGFHDGVIKLRIAEPPVEGAANNALVEFVARRLGVAKSNVRVIGGESSRRKIIEIDGVAPEAVAADLQ